MTTASQKPISLWPIYLVVGGAIAALMIWAMRSTLANTPSRDATADFGPYGLVTIRLTTDPYPPLPTGTVRLSFMPMDSRQRPVPLDSLQFEYGRQGSDVIVGSGRAESMADGSGMFIAGAQVPQVGNWWLRVRVVKGGEQAQVRYTLYVKPAQ